LLICFPCAALGIRADNNRCAENREILLQEEKDKIIILGMKTSWMPNKPLILLVLCAIFVLAACASPSPTAVPTQPVSATATLAATTPAAISDPFAYCAAVGSIDQPGAGYSGEKTPEDLVKKLITASGAAADVPLDMYSQGTFWRCMDKKVYACFVGANLPCDSKANSSQDPTNAMNEFCQANPSSDFLPAVITGHDTIYSWACKAGKAVVDKQVFHVDARGYIQEIWYALGQ
jgi:hypothetical protein